MGWDICRRVAAGAMTFKTKSQIQKTNTAMDQLLDHAPGFATSTDPAIRPFRIVILYENIVSAARALRACEILRGEIPTGAALEINVWKMSGLCGNGNTRPSAKAAARADVVIISASGCGEPPANLAAWVDAWLGHSGAAGSALFTLLGDHATPEAVAFASWLHGKASPSGIDVFSHPAVDSTACAPLRDIPLLMPPKELPNTIHIPIEEWRPGSATASGRMESAFDIIENFGAHLRARLHEVRKQNEQGRHQEKPDTVFC
jgi:hypothetical protein